MRFYAARSNGRAVYYFIGDLNVPRDYRAF